MTLKTIWNLTKNTFTEWQEDKALRLGAALSYYAVFSLAPLLLIVIGIASLAFGSDAARTQIMAQMDSFLGEQGSQAVADILRERSEEPSKGAFATILGFLILLFGASGVVAQLQDALNTMWEVKPKPGLGLMTMIRQRIISFAMVLAVGFLLLISLVISAVIAGLMGYFGTAFPLEVLNFVISLLVVTVLFALIFKILPDAEVKWRNVWIGAIVTALLFTIGKTAIGLYLAKSAVASSFGAAGSLVIVLLWVYYNSQILFLGAEFTQVYSKWKNDQARPKDYAEVVSPDMRAKEGMQPAKKGGKPTRIPAKDESTPRQKR